MSRPKRITEKQWVEIGKRLANGESRKAVGVMYGVSVSTLSKRFACTEKNLKVVANQVAQAEMAVSRLPAVEQAMVETMVDRIKQLHDHALRAAGYSMATAARLSGIAHNISATIDETAPLSGQSRTALQDVSALQNVVNNAAYVGLKLMDATKPKQDESDKEQIIRLIDVPA
jgi:hypothetical protein